MRDTVAASRICRVVPFDVNYVWRCGNQSHPHDALDPEHLTADAKQDIRRMIDRLAEPKKLPTARPFLLEKSVSNSLRVAFVHAVFPEATFIHLVRDGLDVVESAIRMWQAPVQRRYLLRKLRYFPVRNASYAVWYLQNQFGNPFRPSRGHRLWGPRYPGIDEDAARWPLPRICAHQWIACVERALRDFRDLPRERVVTLRYEELVRDESTIERLCAFLDVPDPEAVLAQYRSGLRDDVRRRKALTDEQLALLPPEFDETRSRLGYR